MAVFAEVLASALRGIAILNADHCGADGITAFAQHWDGLMSFRAVFHGDGSGWFFSGLAEVMGELARAVQDGKAPPADAVETALWYLNALLVAAAALHASAVYGSKRSTWEDSSCWVGSFWCTEYHVCVLAGVLTTLLALIGEEAPGIFEGYDDVRRFAELAFTVGSYTLPFAVLEELEVHGKVKQKWTDERKRAVTLGFLRRLALTAADAIRSDIVQFLLAPNYAVARVYSGAVGCAVLQFVSWKHFSDLDVNVRYLQWCPNDDAVRATLYCGAVVDNGVSTHCFARFPVQLTLAFLVPEYAGNVPVKLDPALYSGAVGEALAAHSAAAGAGKGSPDNRILVHGVGSLMLQAVQAAAGVNDLHAVGHLTSVTVPVRADVALWYLKLCAAAAAAAFCLCMATSPEATCVNGTHVRINLPDPEEIGKAFAEAALLLPGKEHQSAVASAITETIAHCLTVLPGQTVSPAAWQVQAKLLITALLTACCAQKRQRAVADAVALVERALRGVVPVLVQRGLMSGRLTKINPYLPWNVKSKEIKNCVCREWNRLQEE